MIQLGTHTIPTGPDEEVIARPTFWEKLTRKLFPDPWAAEEREALLQHARRIKIKTDMLEERRKVRQARLERAEARGNTRVVICTQFWKLKAELYGSYKALLVFSRSLDGKAREVGVESLQTEKGKMYTSSADCAPSFTYIQGTNFYKTKIEPWLNGVHSDEQLRQSLESDANNVTWVK